MNKNKEKIRKKIVDFAKREYRRCGIVPSIRKINMEFNICFRSYFPDGMSKLYKLSGFKFSPQQNRQRSIKRRCGEIQEPKRKKIIDFVKKEYKKSGLVPSVREIDKKLNTSFWGCFPKGMETLYKLCGFKFSPEENKQKSRKEFYLKKRDRMRKEILKCFIQQIKRGIKPTASEISKKFSISLLTYFPKGIRELYRITKMNPPFPLRDRKKIQKEIINYIQSEVKKGYYPSRAQIDEKFHTNIWCSIRKLYELAGVEYKRDPNPFLRYKKERELAEIVKKLFQKLGYKIKNESIGPSKPSGADVIVEDKQKRVVPVEIKAFQKFGKIGHAKNSPYIKSEFLQLKRYIKNLQAPYGYLITSTDHKIFKATQPQNVRILFGKDLKKVLSQFKMYKELRSLDWIRNSSISYGKEEIYKKIRNRILRYTSKRFKEGKYVSEREISKKFKVNPNSYFTGGMREIYKALDIDVELLSNYRMSRKFNKEKFKKRIIDFVKEENKKGGLPTYKEIQRKFRYLPKLYFPGGIREIAKLSGIKYNRKFASKTPEEKKVIRQKIIEYAIGRLRNGFYPGYRDIESKFHINFQYYFNSPEELYQKAGYNNPGNKKTWKNYAKGEDPIK